MKRLDQIAQQLESSWKGDPAFQRCMKIIEFIAKNEPQKSSMLTYQDVASIVGDRQVTDELERALTLLTSRYRVLALHFVFIDELGRRHYLDEEEQRDFIRDGKFSDPDTGDEIPEPAGQLYPYYEARTDELLREAS